MNDVAVCSDYFSAFAGEGIRADARSFLGYRPTLVSSGYLTSCDGSAMVRIGGTVAVAGVTASPLRVGSAGSAAGASPALLTIRATVSPGASARARAARGAVAGAAGRELSALLEASFIDAFSADDTDWRNSFVQDSEASALQASVASALRAMVPRGGVVSPSSLVITSTPNEEAATASSARSGIGGDALPGGNDAISSSLELSAAAAAETAEKSVRDRLRRFFSLSVEVVVLCDDGAMADAAVIAVTAALRATRVGTPAKLPLTLRAVPISSTFALMRQAKAAGAHSSLVLVADPSDLNGEDLDATFLTTPAGFVSGGAGGGGAATFLDRQGTARAHLTVVCDAAGGGGVLATRKLGGEALPASLLTQAMGCAEARAASVVALL
jgi:hypothetical protein